jgi:hypothetical protein
MFNIHELVDDTKCFRTIREMRWPDGVTCSFSNSNEVFKIATMTRNPNASVTSAMIVRSGSTI